MAPGDCAAQWLDKFSKESSWVTFLFQSSSKQIPYDGCCSRCCTSLWCSCRVGRKGGDGVGVTSLWLINTVSFWDRKCRHVGSRKDWNESGLPIALCNHLIGCLHLAPSSRNLHYLRHTYVWFWSLARFWTINLGEYGGCKHVQPLLMWRFLHIIK